MEDDLDIERVFTAATPRKPSAKLRPLILDALAAELEARRSTRQHGWQAWLLRAVAALLLFSAATFLGVDWLETRRMARWDEGTVVRSAVSQVTDLVASISDENAARAVEQSLLLQLRSHERSNVAAFDKEIESIQRWAKEVTNLHRNQHDETAQKRI